jgi:hypothetical protein
MKRFQGLESASSMKQTPGHGANFIKGLKRPIRLGAIDHSSLS